MVPPRGTQAFTATGGSGTGYVWSLAMAPSGGTISAGGAYKAGAAGGVIDVVQVVDSASNTATAQVMVGMGVSVMPPNATLATGATQTFTASGGSPPYLWALTAMGSGTPSISAMGAYTAGANAGMDTVQATDALGSTATATVTVVVAGPLGAPCETASDCPAAPDGNRYCVDFVCCNSACAAQCQACNAASTVGTCVTISGPPVGTRPSCAASDSSKPCTGKACDGKNPNACDVYVGSSTTCSPALCVDGVGTPQAMCLADGGCQSVRATACGAFACVAGACATSCTDDADCSPGSYCNVTTGACITPPSSSAGDAGGAGASKTRSSGCAMGFAPAGTNPLACLAACAAGLAARRRRRPPPPATSTRRAV